MLSELIKKPSFWVIVGVILGFILGEFSTLFRYRWRIWKLKKTIEEELRSILGQIPQKKDIVNQIMAALQKRQILPGVSVDILNIGYNQHISELYEHLSILERNCLHAIYQRLADADKILSSYESELTSALQQGVIRNPFQMYFIRFQEILTSYTLVEELIQSYLDKKAIDVFYIKNS